MILLLPLLLFGVFTYLWWTRRNSTLTRDCRWRQVGGEGASQRFRCVACGAEVELSGGAAPRDCLRPPGV